MLCPFWKIWAAASYVTSSAPRLRRAGNGARRMHIPFTLVVPRRTAMSAATVALATSSLGDAGAASLSESKRAPEL